MCRCKPFVFLFLWLSEAHRVLSDVYHLLPQVPTRTLLPRPGQWPVGDTKSQDLRRVEVGRDLWSLPGPTPAPAGTPRAGCPGPWPGGFGDLQGGHAPLQAKASVAFSWATSSQVRGNKTWGFRGGRQVPQQPLSRPWLSPRMPLQCQKGFRLFAGSSILWQYVGTECGN